MVTDTLRAYHIPKGELTSLQGKVVREGGELRILVGAEHGLVMSVMVTKIEPGGGPDRHRHPYAEIFVIHEGQGRYEVEDSVVDAEEGDVVIVPAETWHTFTNTGRGVLRQVAIHQSPREDTTFEDGSHRG